MRPRQKSFQWKTGPARHPRPNEIVMLQRSLSIARTGRLLRDNGGHKSQPSVLWVIRAPSVSSEVAGTRHPIMKSGLARIDPERNHRSIGPVWVDTTAPSGRDRHPLSDIGTPSRAPWSVAALTGVYCPLSLLIHTRPIHS